MSDITRYFKEKVAEDNFIPSSEKVGEYVPLSKGINKKIIEVCRELNILNRIMELED